jgi:hypothetical protein
MARQPLAVALPDVGAGASFRLATIVRTPVGRGCFLFCIDGETARSGGSVSIHRWVCRRHAISKRHVCAISERWRDIRTMRVAKIVSVVARVQRTPSAMTPSQPATASTA